MKQFIIYPSINLGGGINQHQMVIHRVVIVETARQTCQPAGFDEEVGLDRVKTPCRRVTVFRQRGGIEPDLPQTTQKITEVFQGDDLIHVLTITLAS